MAQARSTNDDYNYFYVMVNKKYDTDRCSIYDHMICTSVLVLTKGSSSTITTRTITVDIALARSIYK